MPDDRDLVGVLLRWEEAGGVWRVESRTPSRVTVALLRCDGGEEVERLSTSDAATLAYVDDHDPAGPTEP